MSFTSGLFASLNLTDKAMLCEILRSVQQLRPAEQFSVRRSTLEARLGVSSATATRWLSRLRQQGWIEREQVLSRAHGFQVSTMKLTEQAICALALRQAASLFLRESLVSHPEESSDQSSTKRQSADAAGLCEDQVSDHQARTATDSPKASAEGLDKPGTPAHDDGSSSQAAGVCRSPQKRADAHATTPSIPEPLQPLLGLLSAVQVCFLMRRARAHGHRLEDVVLPCLQSIRSSRSPLPYVLRLLRLPRDWAGIRRRMVERGVSCDLPHPIATVERREGEERVEFAKRAARANAETVARTKADIIARLAGKHFAPKGASSRGASDVVWRISSWGVERMWTREGHVAIALERDSLSFLAGLETRLNEVSGRDALALLRVPERGLAAHLIPPDGSLADGSGHVRERAIESLKRIRQGLKASRFSAC